MLRFLYNSVGVLLQLMQWSLFTCVRRELVHACVVYIIYMIELWSIFSGMINDMVCSARVCAGAAH